MECSLTSGILKSNIFLALVTIRDSRKMSVGSSFSPLLRFGACLLGKLIARLRSRYSVPGRMVGNCHLDNTHASELTTALVRLLDSLEHAQLVGINALY